MQGTSIHHQHSKSRRWRLRGWYAQKRRTRVDAEIREILKLYKATGTYERNAPTLPSTWAHKPQALAGDTVYLAHDNSIRSFILSATDELEPQIGRVSVVSPIGRALLGKHAGEVVHLATLDDTMDYTILKIV